MFLKCLKRILGILVLVPFAVSADSQADQMSQEFADLLEKHNLPGISIVIVDNYEIVYTGAFGEKEAGQRVDTETAFAAASVSKVVTAVVAAMLAEQGVIDLDKPVTTYLRRWMLPASEFTTNIPITLRHLLTHTAGINQSGFAAYFLGDAMPSLVESLQGEKLKRPLDPIKVMWEPESRFSYSGGGITIVQLAIEDITGQPLSKLAQEMLFKPLGMQNSTMYQSGEAGFLVNVAKAHQHNGAIAGAGGLPIYPQYGAAGMWTTPKDMAKLMIDMQKALRGNKKTVISAGVARELTRIQTLHKAGGWGLGWMRYMANGNLDWFSHSGYGAGIGGQVMATLQDGRAIAVFGNGAHQARVPAIDEAIANIIHHYGWKRAIKVVPDRAVEASINALQGHYYNFNRGFFSPFNEVVSIFAENGKLMLDNSFGTRKPYELISVGGGRYRMDEFVSADIGLIATDIAFFHSDAQMPAKVLLRLDNQFTPPYTIAKQKGFELGLKAYQVWVDTNPNTLLLRVQTFETLAKASADAGHIDEAITFYRLGLHFHPEESALEKALHAISENKNE